MAPSEPMSNSDARQANGLVQDVETLVLFVLAVILGAVVIAASAMVYGADAPTTIGIGALTALVIVLCGSLVVMNEVRQ